MYVGGKAAGRAGAAIETSGRIQMESATPTTGYFSRARRGGLSWRSR
jgi:hypothetical protein